MKTFVVHYNKLTKRKDYMLIQLKENNIDAEFVEQYTRDNLTEKDKKIFDRRVNNPNIAISLSHLYCYKEISQNYDYALILEDDAIFCENFKAKLLEYITQLPDDWDMLFLDDCCNFHIENINPHQYIYKKDLKKSKGGGMGATRGTGCYLVSKKCANKITKNIEDYYYTGQLLIHDQIDFWLNYVFRRNNFNIYWAEPTISTQGTQNGTYYTSHPLN
jgi:GR25 family glycosyltransferase involved in LPS biosynthesis